MQLVTSNMITFMKHLTADTCRRHSQPLWMVRYTNKDY